MRLNVKTHASKTYSMVQKNTKPPKDQGGWMAVTKDILESSSYRSLSANAHKALDRLRVEHISHMRSENGNLIVLHEQFYDYGVTAEYVADALDELAYKGLIKMRKGRAGNGTAHPTIFTLTFDGTRDGLPATNDWKKITEEQTERWSKVERKRKMEDRAALGRKRKSSLRDSEIRPLRDSEMRKAS
jgi:hypothetical protein